MFEKPALLGASTPALQELNQVAAYLIWHLGFHIVYHEGLVRVD